MSDYLKVKKVKDTPCLPLKAEIDLTYRCNNNCRHCWSRIPARAREKKKELSFEEIRRIVDEARKMGCRKWVITGGEPMIRGDFAKIFDYITRNSATYSLNTNGTLITPKIAKLMKRRGAKMVALYGAGAGVHDYITRHPGSFKKTMRGLMYLKEAGAGFTVQIIPMKDNYHQLKEMVGLAESLSKHHRIGASWLYLSASGNLKRNKEIMRQRLLPKDVVKLQAPDISYDEWVEKNEGCRQYRAKKDKGLFADCITTSQKFHIDPYGRASFCYYINDPIIRYDLRKGSLKEYWENFMPSLADKTKCTGEYIKNCGSCELRRYCDWCPAYAYLEKRRFSAKADYLCAVAGEYRNFKDNWRKDHRRYYRIADITIQVDSDLPIEEGTFRHKFKLFEADGPGDDTIAIRHHFSLPKIDRRTLGKKLYHRAPWIIYKKKDSWIYCGTSPSLKGRDVYRLAVFNHDYARGRIYNKNKEDFRRDVDCLTHFGDQILLAQVLAHREGCYIHSSGMILNGKGLLFVGHSEAGKSTMAKILKDKAEVLCDDRIIVRKKPEGFRIYGTWSHGEVRDVSANSAPLRAILFLEKSDENYLEPLEDKKEIIKRLLACLVRPLVTGEWWDKALSLVERITNEVPCYIIRFDKAGGAAELLEKRIR
jgi:radical SAM protein with 4Fe4S-binding SPASM domain